MSGAAAAAAQAAMAIKASGTLVQVEADAFVSIVARQQAPLVVHTVKRMARKRYHYLCSYKGLGFFTKSATPLALPEDAEVVLADKIWMP